MVLFSIPAVQTKIASIVTKNINEDFGTDLVIKKVDFSLLGSVALKGIEIRDHHKDTLIFIDRLRTSLLNAKRVLDNEVDLGSVSMKGIYFHLKTYKNENLDNLTVFTEKLEDDNPRDPSVNPFLLKTSNIYLEELNFRQENENDKVPLTFAAYKGGGSLQDFLIQGPNVSTKIRGLYFEDNRGVEITKLTTDFAYTKSQMQFYNTIIATPYSELNVQLEFNYQRDNLSKFNELVFVNATFDKSHLSILDLKKLYNELSGDDVLRFTGKVAGTLNNHTVTNLKLTSDKGIKVSGDMNFINAISQEDFFFTGDIENLTADYYKLKDILPNLLGKTLPTEFQRLGEFSLSGFTKLTPKVIEATLEIDSEIGVVVTDLEVTNFDNIDEATYKGEFEMDAFDIGAFFNDPLLGNISFGGNVDGKGFRIDNISTSLIGKVFEIQFNEYTYKNIDVNGKYENNLFNGKLSADDDNLKGTFEGLADISEDIYQFDFTANIGYADLKAIKIYSRDSISQLEGTVDLDLRGNTLDNIVGVANFKNVQYKNQKETYLFKQFLVFSNTVDGIKQIRIDSEDIVKGELTGVFQFKELLPLAQNALGSIYSNYNPYEVTPNQFLNFDFRIYNQVVDVFFPDVSVAPNTKIKGDIRSNENQLKLKITSPKIIAFGNIIDSLELDTDNKRKYYDTSLKAKKLETSFYKVSNLLLFNKTINDTLYFKSAFKGGDLEKENFNLDFYYTINDDKKSVLGVERSNFNYKGNSWSINPEGNKNNKLTFDLKKEEYIFSPFQLESNEQKVTFNGVVKDSTYKDLKVDFKNVYLKSFLPEIDSLKFRGKLNGGIDFQQKLGLYSPKGNLTVDNFFINNYKQGNLALNVEGEDSYQKYKVDFSLDRDRVKSIAATGTIDFSKVRPIIDLSVFLEDFQLDAFGPLGEDVLSAVRGAASGDVQLEGFLNNPDMNGNLLLKNAGLKFPYLNVDYDFDGDTTIGLQGQSFVFNNIALKDTKYATEGTLNGYIAHQNFRDWFLDLNIASNNLLVLDTQDSEEALYYGTGFIQGNASITGLTDNITINVNAKTMPQTLFVIPLKDIASVDTYHLIHFKSEKKIEDLQKEIAIKSAKGVSLRVNLEVTKDAIAQVVIDESNGSELKGSGTGDLNIDIDNRGNFTMDGDFTIDNGFYNFKYGGVINKPFAILKGGTISWDGNPYQANLNVTAVYTTNANPAVLLENFNTNRKIPVDLVTRISGSLFNSKQEFDIEIPNSNSTIASELDFVLNDNDVNSKMRQFFSLLALGSFANPNNNNINGNQLLTGTTSNAVGAILSDIISSNKLQLDVGYTTGDIQNPEANLNTDNTLDVSVTTQLSKNIIVNGKVGVPVGTQTQSSVVGEVKVEVLLNEGGNFRGVIFNRQNEIQYSAQEEGYTQGVGLSYQVNFNTLSELLQKVGLKKKSKKKPAEKKKDTVLSRHKGLINYKKSQ